MRAFSPSQPEEGSQAEVVVQVRRNKQSPRFEEAAYSASLAEDLSPGASVVRMRATDADEQVPCTSNLFRFLCNSQ